MMQARAPSQSCVVCAAPAVKLQAAFERMLRVTSDSRIWKNGGQLGICESCGMVQKPADSHFLHEAEEIYASYQLYVQSGGNEQKIFTTQGTKPRSELLLDLLTSQLDTSKIGRLLDVGCGAGNLLHAAAKRLPGWALYGNDISTHRREEILRIENVRGFFEGDVETIGETFDVICLSHVLEHVPNPQTFLRQLSALLKPGGILMIAVPNWTDNAFDLLVADHCAHFTPSHLEMLLARAGYDRSRIDAKSLPKEIVAVTTYSAIAPQSHVHPDTTLSRQQLDKTLHWLESMKQWAVESKRQPGDYAVFGTAIAATWLTHAVELAPVAFVDEDVDRQGRNYLGKPVLAPSAIPVGTRVLIPLPPPIAKNVATRLDKGHAGPVFLVPPKME